MVKLFIGGLASIFLAISSGGSISNLWNKYERAGNEDRPKEQMEILNRIADKAEAQKSTWDFFRANALKVEIGARMNWKLRDSLNAGFEREIQRYIGPVALFFNRSACNGINIIPDADREELAAGSHPEFWKRDPKISYYYRDALLYLFRNDLDYACWVTDENIFKDRHPLGELFEYKQINEGDTAALKSFAERYKGEVVALPAEGELLYQELKRLERCGSNEDFLALRRKCEALNASKDAFKGEERKLAHMIYSPNDVIAHLESEYFDAEITRGTLRIVMRNLKDADLNIKKEERIVFSKHLINPVQSFYRYDTINYVLPELDDGTYKMECTSGENKVETEYNKYTIASAFKKDSRGFHAYLADYMIGKPLFDEGFIPIDSVDGIYCYSYRGDDGILHSTGPQSIRNMLSDKDLFAYKGMFAYNNDNNDRHSIVLLDCAAFSPGETVYFKTIVYDGRNEFRGAGEGISLVAKLLDPRGAVIETQELTTNGFGSAAGQFELKKTGRNGTYTIVVYDANDGKIGSENFEVGDFQLPTFELNFDGGFDESLNERPDSICFSGKVVSCSGHNLSAAGARYAVHGSGIGESMEGELQLDAYGRFCVKVATNAKARWQSYSFHITIVDATGETLSFRKHTVIDEQANSEEDKFYTFEDIEGDGIGIKIIAGMKPTWAVWELYGEGNVLLEKRLEYFEPDDGPATCSVTFDYKDSYPDVVKLYALYFQDGSPHWHNITKRRISHRLDLPLKFGRFLDITCPGASYTFTIKTLPGVECAAAIYDKSTCAIRGNEWLNKRDKLPEEPDPYKLPLNWGTNSAFRWNSVRHRSPRSEDALPECRNCIGLYDVRYGNVIVEEAALPFMLPPPKSVFGGGSYIRSKFSNTVAWEPFLRSDEEGNINFTFTNADKLSTYYVQIFAHDRDFRNEVFQREMTVTIPVKVAVVQPRFLVNGDRYTAAATVNNSLDEDVSGTIRFNGGNPVRVLVPAGGQATASCDFEATDKEVPLEVVFTADNEEYGFDGVRVAVPVRPASQTITEAHSTIFKHGMDRDSLISVLRGQFVGVDGGSAEISEKSIRNMIDEALPAQIEPDSDNIIDLVRALAARRASGIKFPEGGTSDETLLRKIGECRNRDGGYGWFKGMKSSPLLTAYVLYVLKPDLQDSGGTVRYLDNVQFSGESGRTSGLDNGTYMQVRSLYPEIAFEQKVDDDFRKYARRYLCGTGPSGLDGNIMAKARRIATLRALYGSEGGIELAGKWGVRLFSASWMEAREHKDLESLSQYAVRHPSGAVYFPNAVMPFRGLMENELDAHNLLCEIFDGRGDGISDGIRLWLMIQKETQNWNSSPASIKAIQNMMAAPAEVLDTRILALSKSYSSPIADIRASGNGFSIRTEDVTTGKVGNVGRITCTIHSDENRSFVKVTIPHCAGLRPVNQLSGPYGWNAYRNVCDDRTEYWFDPYPEETITITEEFYISQEGSFRCPAASVVCEYADYYRANSDARPAMTTTR